jgi:cation diffusion facilitator family transporter
MSKERIATKTAVFSILSNLLLAIIKFISGIIGHSYALIADAIESTSDVLSSTIVLLGLKYSSKPPDANHPYGHGRIEPLITFLVVIFLTVSATVISYQSILNIITPDKVPNAWTLIVLGVIIAWKEISFRFVSKRSKMTNSSALKADAWHHRSDALTSITAFIGILISVVFGDGFQTADDWAALVAGVIIIYNAYKIFRPALGELMDEHLHDDLVHTIRYLSNNVEGIVTTEKCFVRKTGMYYQVDLHAIVDANISVREGHSISHRLKEKIQKELPSINSIHIHIEPTIN